jgi:hypothetical protein
MKTNRTRRISVAAGALVALASVALPARGADLDLRAGAYVDAEKPFVGVGLLTHAGGSIYFNPNVEYVFVDSGTLATGNIDAHYDLPTGHHSPYVWIGGGLALVYSKPEGGDSETKPRVNIFGGLGLRGHGSVPYVQAKYVTGLDTFVLAAGIRF